MLNGILAVMLVLAAGRLELSLESVVTDYPSPAGWDAVVRDCLCYATTREGVAVLDVSRPDSVQFVSVLATPGLSRHLDLSDSLLFVADDYAGLTVVSIADPASPRLIGRCVDMSCAFDVGHWGTFVYVSDSDEGLIVLDASSPSRPTRLHSVPQDVELRGLLVSYPFLFACARDYQANTGSVQVYDISTPANPVLVGELVLPQFSSWSVALRDSILYVCSSMNGSQTSSFALISVADPTNPSLLGQFLPPGGAAVYDVALRAQDTLAFLAAYTRNLVILNVADPTRPQLVSNLRVDGGQTEGLTVIGNCVLLLQASLETGLVSVDVSDPAVPVRVGNLSGGSGYERIWVCGSMAFLCCGDGVDIIDLADLRNPSKVGHCPTPSPPWAVAADSHALFSYSFTGGRGRLDVYDISNPRDPLLLTTCDTFMPHTNLLLHGDYLYYIGNLRGLGSTYLVCVNVANPAVPSVAGKCQYFARGGNYELAFDRNRPYIYATEYMMLRVFDVDDPLGPTEVARCSLPGSGAAISVDARFAYVADYTEGLTVIDIGQPTRPCVIGSYNDPLLRGAVGVISIKNAAVVANGKHGLWLLDAADPSAINLEDTFETPYWAHYLQQVGDTVLAQSDGCRVQFWSVSGTGLAEADDTMSRGMNGFSLRVTPSCGRGPFSVSLQSGVGQARIDVYAIDGRLVARTPQGRQSGGDYLWRWQPGSGPQHLPAGVYSIVVRSSHSSEVTRVVFYP